MPFVCVGRNEINVFQILAAQIRRMILVPWPNRDATLGSCLYITFMAVAPAFRRYGTAVQLLETAVNMAGTQKMKKIQLVALPKLVEFYRVMGFRRIRTLPHYLPESGGELMEKDV